MVARHEFDLLREILKLSLDSFEPNRNSYHLSCDPAKIPANPSDVSTGRARYRDQFPPGPTRGLRRCAGEVRDGDQAGLG